MLIKPITHDKWLEETKVGGIFGEKSRSTLLLQVDTGLLAYEGCAPLEKLTKLHVLYAAYDAWYAKKTEKKPDAGLKSIRNNGDQMTVFEDWLKEEEARQLPAAEDGWNNGPNCYAYAMKQKLPVGSGMTPGSADGVAVTSVGIKADWMQYSKRLFDGIKRDAAKDGNKAVSFYPVGVENSNFHPDPIEMPLMVPSGHYLVAMLVTNCGFHFMRRNPHTNLWSHKNGSFGVVETYAEHAAPAGRLGRKHSPISNLVAVELLRNQSPGQTYLPIGGGFKFAGYIVVPDEGIVVSGLTKPFS